MRVRACRVSRRVARAVVEDEKCIVELGSASDEHPARDLGGKRCVAQVGTSVLEGRTGHFGGLVAIDEGTRAVPRVAAFDVEGSTLHAHAAAHVLDDHRPLLQVSFGDDVEEHVRGVGGVGEVADLVDHEDVRVRVRRERLAHAAGITRMAVRGAGPLRIKQRAGPKAFSTTEA